jgi:hypothetical protein
MKLKYYKEHTKYVVADYWEHKLILKFHINYPFDNNKFFLKEKADGWYIGFYKGARTDGVTSWFDNDFLLKASFGHDILCELIEVGAIPESDNSRIDAEFELMILANNRDYPWWKGGSAVKHIRARLARRGTNLVHSRQQTLEPVIYEI